MKIRTIPAEVEAYRFDDSADDPIPFLQWLIDIGWLHAETGDFVKADDPYLLSMVTGADDWPYRETGNIMVDFPWYAHHPATDALRRYSDAEFRFLYEEIK